MDCFFVCSQHTISDQPFNIFFIKLTALPGVYNCTLT